METPIARPEAPEDMFDRRAEWEALSKFVTDSGGGLRVGLVYGRRRQGKSYLLRRLARATGGFYYQALQQQNRPALDDIGAALGGHFGTPGRRIHLDNWVQAVDALLEADSGKIPRLVILDEFPYLVANAPELPSILQRVTDASQDDRISPIRMILCGSAVSVMTQLASGGKALRGRISLDLVLRPFDFRTSAGYWTLSDNAPAAFAVDAVVGGTPGYRDLIRTAAPTAPEDVGRWLSEGVLDPSNILFREHDLLLAEESGMTDVALYQSMLKAIASGHRSQAAIAATLGREQRAVQHPLGMLERAGLVVRDDDVLRQRRPFFRVADPMVRFHQVITRPDLARFEERRTLEAWADASSRWRSLILGPHFEDLARTFFTRYATAETSGGVVGRVGAAVINDPQGATQHQIDVVALGRPGKRPKVRVIGEAKYSSRACSPKDLVRLEKIRALLTKREDVDTRQTRLAIIAANGFDGALLRMCRDRKDCLLLDLDALYHGS